MKKILTFGWKDLTIVFRDRAALMLMLAAPFVLTLAMGLVTGAFEEQDGPSRIPVLIVNQDQGPLGEALQALLQGDEFADLLAAQSAGDPQAARQAVENDDLAAALIVPPGFSAGVFEVGASSATPSIELYANPGRPLQTRIVQTVVERFLAQVDGAVTGAQITVMQLIQRGDVQSQEALELGMRLGEESMAGAPSNNPISLHVQSGAQESFNLLAYFAPAMATLFLMYTVSQGGRNILAERDQGTLARLLSTPTSSVQILAGKVFGIYLTGVAQVGILILGSSLLFGLVWGDSLALIALMLALVAGATGWGLLLAAFMRTPQQVSSYGTALMLTFGILGGSFISIDAFPGWLQALSKLTPNAWALQGFTRLALGGTLPDVAGILIALILMAAGLFALSVFAFRRNGLETA